MRLIKLKVKNIASLKGEHVINFSEIQHMSPLFAITGETGAGKSSILNAIGLVLYGKVYKSNVTQNDVVTLGEKEGQIELIFQTQGANFLATWRARVRKQNGELYSTPQTPQRELYALSGDDFESEKNIVLTKTEELLNLDFDQFCKCIILNQGEFARFLSSSFTERKEILEKLYPGELLESLSRELKAELDHLLKQKSELEIELSTLKGEGLQEGDLRANKESLEQNYKLHEGWLTKLESLEYHFQSLLSYHGKNRDTQTKIEAVKQGLSQETTAFNEILHETQRVTEDLLLLQKEQEEKLPALQELLKEEENLKNLDSQKAELEKSLQKNSSTLKALDERYSDLQKKLATWELRSKEVKESFALPLLELRAHHGSFTELFELFEAKDRLDQELSEKTERLTQLELQGKEEAQELKLLENKISSFEEERSVLNTLEEKRKALGQKSEEKQRALLRSEELALKLRETNTEQEAVQKKIEALSSELSSSQQELLPLETTLKLQNLLNAVEVCLTHPSIEEKGSCPVCLNPLSNPQIKSLQENLARTDLTKLKVREAELNRRIMKAESELAQFKREAQKLSLDLESKKKELESYGPLLELVLPDLKDLEEQVSVAKKKVWEQEKILKDQERLRTALGKSREQYVSLKKDITLKTDLRTQKTDLLQKIHQKLTFVTELNQESIALLKTEARKLTLQLELDSQGEMLLQDKKHQEENLKTLRETLQNLQTQVDALATQAQTLREKLLRELAGKNASELILEITKRVKSKADELAVKEKNLRAQELKLKECQSRLYTLEELIKDIDLQFAKEHHTLKALGSSELPVVNEDLRLLMEKIASLALDLAGPYELFEPLRDLIQSQKEKIKHDTSELKKAYGAISARLEDWEKKQDKISLLLLKSQDLSEQAGRRSRLYEVLGKDELRTFVLSLVEENLITQTNDELQKLCQGRYEIVHQSRKMKITPEFYILDKFREGGLRKVSTLSGGETFMVSLAMALGLAEMTRGKAQIDSLFIDEGFGTLDQESLEDVLDMLKQIQNRGLMVGIISHVKALTQALPVNLLVSKKQDGTSSVGMVFN